jgi:hypothetical protein
MNERTITITHTDRILSRIVTVTETGPVSEAAEISQHVRSTLNEEIERARHAARTAHAITTHDRNAAISQTDARHGWDAEPLGNPDPIGVSA